MSLMIQRLWEEDDKWYPQQDLNLHDQLRRLAFYPVELWGHQCVASIADKTKELNRHSFK